MATNGLHLHTQRPHYVEDEDRTRVKNPKKLIVCCDGTWMDSDNGYVNPKWGQPGHMENPTNVTRIARAIASDDDRHHPQIVYYQAGIGTGLSLSDHLIGGGTGLGLAEHVREAYAFLASNYSQHDDLVAPDGIFLIGFSRGAFTARSLGGFIAAMGILNKPAMPHFYDIFNDWESAGNGRQPRFFTTFFDHHHDLDEKRQHDIETKMAILASKTDDDSRDTYLQIYFRYLQTLELTQKAEINAIGVFDTVGALGIPVNPVLGKILPCLPSFIKQYKWFDTRLDNQIKYAFQALALDERRFPYAPAVWERRHDCTTKLKQVWFPGAHSNVGGSYDDSGSANITLAWMMDQLSGNTIEDKEHQWKARDWIKFDDSYIQNWFDCELDWLEQHKTKDVYKGWGLGKLFDSLTPPQSWAGSQTRSPGRYHRTFYISGKTDAKHPLENTNEFVHACVRARLDLGGRAPEPDWSQLSFINLKPAFIWLYQELFTRRPATYKPHARRNLLRGEVGGPLEGWQLLDGHTSHDEPNFNIDMVPDGLHQIKWVYTGTDKIAKKELLEAILVKGGYEWKLLSKDKLLAQRITFSNNGWHWVRTPVEPPRHGRTFEIEGLRCKYKVQKKAYIRVALRCDLL